MTSYVQTILLTVAGCHILLTVASEFGGENLKKLLRFLCGLIVLLILFYPLQDFLDNIDHFWDTVWQEETVSEISPEEQRVQSATDSAYAYVAEAWMQYLYEEYDIPSENIRLVLTTGEDGTLISAEITLRKCTYAVRKKIEKELQSQTDIKIITKGE